MGEAEGNRISAAPLGPRVFEVPPEPQQRDYGMGGSKEKVEEDLLFRGSQLCVQAFYQSKMPCAFLETF